MRVICPACNSENPDAARFCNRCGTRLDTADGSQRTGTVQLRQVTVLVCDLVQSTELSNVLDYEDLLNVFHEFRNIVRSIAHEHSGYRLRFVGDGARVIFGHPDTREDATESAVRCGLALVDAIRALRCVHKPLELRVGIAFGTAVLGNEIEETALTDEAVVGTVAHLAARLMAVAPPSGVVIDHSTRKLIGGFFDCRDLGTLSLKGFEQGVRSWSALGETGVVSRHMARRTGVADDRLIGRDAEVACLHELWRQTASGRGCSVILVGDPGLGKSRLAHALDDVAQGDGATCLEIDCTPRTQNTPLFPVSILAHHMAGIEPSDSDQVALERGRTLLGQMIGIEADAAMPYLGPLFTSSEMAAGVSGESAELIRERTSGFILDVVNALAKSVPVLIRFEDLQWSDPTTATLLKRLVADSHDCSILTIITARSESDIAPLEFPHVTVMRLPPLNGTDSHALIRQVADGEHLSQRTVESIIARGEGVPLYLEELTRSVLDARRRDSSNETDAPPLPEIPATLQNVIQGRLDRRPALLGTTKAAAVMGREFSLQLLGEVLGAPLSELHNAVARLVDDGILILPDPKRPDSVRFKHSLIQEAVYQTLLRSERQQLHSRASDILMGPLAGTPHSSPDVLAYHLRSARRFEDAVRCLVAASADNIAKAAYMESVGHCRAGLALVDSLDEATTRTPLRRQLLIQLALALSAASGYAAPEVEEAYREARASCDDQSEPQTLYPTLRGIATFHLVRGDLALTHELSLQCLALAERAGRPEFAIDASMLHGYATYYFGRLADSRGALERCLAMYRAERGERFTYPAPQDAGTGAWGLLPTVAWLMGDAAAAEAAVAGGLEHVERLARPFDTAVVHAWIAGTRYTQRRFAEAADHARISAEVSERFGIRLWLATSRLMACLAEAALRPAPEALAVARQLCAGFDAAGIGLNASYYLLGIARGLVKMSDVDGARAVIAEGFRRADQSGESRMNAELMILQAELEPDAAVAGQGLAAALALAEEQGAVTTALRAALAVLERSGGNIGSERPGELLTMFNGDAPLPENWIPDQLRKAKQALQGLSAPAPKQ
jgi:class 3 adenylate cyclase